MDGRKSVFQQLSNTLKPEDKTIWFHAASLGEYEQGLPVIEKIKILCPNHKIILTFFSPSGFENKKNNTVCYSTIYLPLDSKSNAKRFIELVHPEFVFFIKYEYWPNYLNELERNHIKTYLISGVFRKNQAFFKWYGGFYRDALTSFSHFFVQNKSSEELLLRLGHTNVSVSGDTRFDRVVSILDRDNQLDFIQQFKQNKLGEKIKLIVIGSSWPKDDNLLINYINHTKEPVKFVIAPHNINSSQILEIKNAIGKRVILFSEIENSNIADYDVLIIDNIGMLTKIYSYADIAYVGGGFGNPGVHNILEPATFGIPIIIGPNFTHFEEAISLVNKGGCITIDNQQKLNSTFNQLLQNDDLRMEKGKISASFVQLNKGATDRILNHVLNHKPH